MQFINTSQHYNYELDEVFIKEFSLPKHVNLEIGAGTPCEQIGVELITFEKYLMAFKPYIVIVIGDTNSTLIGAFTSVKLHIPVAHIEAGLRSFDKNMPEEIKYK